MSLRARILFVNETVRSSARVKSSGGTGSDVFEILFIFFFNADAIVPSIIACHRDARVRQKRKNV